MNVLMTADAVGGVWSYALALTRGLTARGTRVTLAVTGPAPSDAQARAALDAGAVDVRHAPFRLEWMQGGVRDAEATGAWLADVARESGADLVHANGYAHAAVPWDVPVVCVAHSSVTTWWHAVHGEAPPHEYTAYDALVRDALDAADAVVTPTRAFADALRAHHACSRRVDVIPNVTLDAPAPDEKAPFVLATGRLWDASKNLTTLDAASARVPWPVRVAGARTDPDAGTRVDAAHAELLGRVDDATLRDALARASVFAHPSVYEPFGLAPLEAAHAGCALVLSDVPTLREVWGGAATFVPARDADAWADALTRLAEDDDERARMATRARERARAFDPAAFADAYARLHARLAGDGSLTLTEEERTTCAS